MAPFSNEVKKYTREKQAGHCLICGKVCNLENHHIICKNALLPLGIRGKDIKENDVGLCGTNDNDCHEIADRKAIDEHLFFKNGKFVKFEEIDPIQYEVVDRKKIDNIDIERQEAHKQKKQKKREQREIKRLTRQIKEMGYRDRESRE